MTNEFELIQKIRDILPTFDQSVTIGIGDDCAVVPVADKQILLATDMLVDQVHFDSSKLEMRHIGRKSVAVNLSDIAAMAGKPVSILVSLALPYDFSRQSVLDLMGGMLEVAEEYETKLVGGDTTSHDGALVINVAIQGEVLNGCAVLRSGAQQGDSIFVTGPLGGSLAGHHWKFHPRVTEAQSLHTRYQLNSMIDISDGLASDIRHITKSSGVGCTLWENEIPISDRVSKSLDKVSRLNSALGDGEDFELLFTVSQRNAQSLRDQTEISVHEIGVISSADEGELLKLSSGDVVPIPELGWKHQVEG